MALVSKNIMNINMDKFIENIKNRPEIWDRTFLANKPEIDLAWVELSEMYQLAAAVLKAKWKSLRDMFRVELRKLPRNENDDLLIQPEEFQSKYPYYNQLLFLAEHMRFRAPFRVQPSQDTSLSSPSPSSSSIKIENVTSDFDDSREDITREMLERISNYRPGSIFEPIIEQHVMPASKQFNERIAQQQNVQITSSSGKRKRSSMTPTTTMVSTPAPKTSAAAAAVAESGEVIDVDSDSSSGIGGERPPIKDSDYHFLMSLHPYMVELNATQKLRIRNKIQKLIFKELYDADDEDM